MTDEVSNRPDAATELRGLLRDDPVKEFLALGTICASCAIVCLCAAFAAFFAKEYVYGTFFSAATAGAGTLTWVLASAAHAVSEERRERLKSVES